MEENICICILRIMCLVLFFTSLVFFLYFVSIVSAALSPPRVGVTQATELWTKPWSSIRSQLKEFKISKKISSDILKKNQQYWKRKKVKGWQFYIYIMIHTQYSCSAKSLYNFEIRAWNSISQWICVLSVSKFDNRY